MKLGPAEGTPEEIKNFLEDHGLQADKLFQEPEKPIAAHWFALSAVVVIVSMAILTLYKFSEPRAETFIFLVGCGGALWLAANIQLRFKNAWAAGGVLICCVLFLLVALGVLLPSDLPAEARKWNGKS